MLKLLTLNEICLTLNAIACQLKKDFENSKEISFIFYKGSSYPFKDVTEAFVIQVNKESIIYVGCNLHNSESRLTVRQEKDKDHEGEYKNKLYFDLEREDVYKRLKKFIVQATKEKIQTNKNKEKAIKKREKEIKKKYNLNY